MVNIAELKIGGKVCYQPEHYGEDKYENGMVKEVPDHSPDSVRVVYNCNGDWKNYRDYTSALTNACDLINGWIMKKYCISVSRIVPEEALSYKDSEDNPSGLYYELALSKEKALDQFNAYVPISIPEHFDVIAELIGEELINETST